MYVILRARTSGGAAAAPPHVSGRRRRQGFVTGDEHGEERVRGGPGGSFGACRSRGIACSPSCVVVVGDDGGA
ncbi:hypothetical protein BD626DRAFT_493022 [Schizophyllum amplum]|uniref:Uncharacterized protein n=1 Tax=Schizophyllum amplum TaxID=97359 RepID=A0A550CGF0_9AGAR|nr:hypothetical protein BD626DRAFT_493022 [Auriculariopsis ampla]